MPSKASEEGKPSEENKPSVPSMPSIPGIISEPSKPSVPSRENEPSVPSQESEPGKLSVPSQENEPGKPSAPSQVSEPELPDEPSAEPKKAESMSVKKSLTLEKKQKQMITVTIKPMDAANQKFTVKSLNPDIVKVLKTSENAFQIQAKKAGIAVITVKTNDGSKITKKLTVKVEPDKVTKVKASTEKGGRVKLTWEKQAEADGYKVECYDTKSKKWKKVTTVKKNKATITRSKRKKPYEFRVSAYVKSGKETVYGDASKVRKVTIKK